MSKANRSASALARSADVMVPSIWAERISLTLFWGIHVGCLAAIWTGVSLRAAIIGIVLYWVRMFAVTGGYHRYFSHRTYKTSRWFQFVLGMLATSSIQKGPLWWASKHRHHHKYSDMPEDVHSPRQAGFWYSHVGWITSGDHVHTDLSTVRDLAKFPELVWLTGFHWVAPLLMGIGCFLAAGWSGLVVGMGWSTVACWHGTFTINSLTHVLGRRRYPTTDDSRNNWWLALITMGEGWHNNHHYYQSTARQGFYWWEYDVTYYILKALSAVGVVWDLKQPPARVYDPAVRIGGAAVAEGSSDAMLAATASEVAV